MLSYFRKSTSFKALGLLAVGTSLMMSCSKDQVAPASSPAETTHVANASYSGEELFQGIFLMQGNVAAHIPYFAPLRAIMAKNMRQHPEQQQKQQETAQRITQLVKQQNPGYFAELKAAISSQNFNRIEASLNKGAALHKTAILSFSPALQHSRRADQLRKLDLSKYNFSKQEDLERYLSDAKAAVGTSGSETGLAAEDEVDTGYVIAVYYWQAFAFYYFVTLGADQSSDSQVSSVMQQRANLEKEKLVRDLAFLQAAAR
ncbi:hypothetical protein [Hymenobacter chitinivorans]|uniref:SdpC family antimicrobial peptide n=1 Tax=Hymenobacter chitinivorans DSM 11115 TaxID=1121954 RepID=A0A2M9BMQ2_9BACT|nr:hypothetical protein [Hymenobacter chitinivorans]PJJ59215.1 SdpC family antimicrobial peptide [Hymenobacter chitinivorans DSM 11115]